MQTQTVRQCFQCIGCEKEYKLTFELSGYPELLVTCPYCGTQGVWETDRFRPPTQDLYKTADTRGDSTKFNGYDFPRVVHPSPVEEKGE